MTRVLLIASVLLICLTMLAGGALFFLVGVAKKRGSMRRVGTVFFFSSMFGATALYIYASGKVLHKLKRASLKQYWHAIVDATFDDTSTPALHPAEAKRILKQKLSNAIFLNDADVEGVWVEGAVLSYGYFMYKADEKELLKAVATAPIDSSFRLPSDNACREIRWDECADELTYQKGPERNLPGWRPEPVASKHCYRCLRSPWSHAILIDGKTGKVYHSISEIRE